MTRLLCVLVAVMLTGCTMTMPISQCKNETTIYQETGVTAAVRSYPCWESVKVETLTEQKVPMSKQTRLLHLVDRFGKQHTQDVGP